MANKLVHARCCMLRSAAVVPTPPWAMTLQHSAQGWCGNVGVWNATFVVLCMVGLQQATWSTWWCQTLVAVPRPQGCTVCKLVTAEFVALF